MHSRGGKMIPPRFFQEVKKMKGIRNLFQHEITPYQVEDKVTFRNVDKTLTLFVRSDAAGLVTRLIEAEKQMKEITVKSDECQRVNVARFFAQAIFGEDQGNRLFDFYNDPLAVLAVCGDYFKTRLGKKITKAQKK